MNASLVQMALGSAQDTPLGQIRTELRAGREESERKVLQERARKFEEYQKGMQYNEQTGQYSARPGSERAMNEAHINEIMSMVDAIKSNEVKDKVTTSTISAVKTGNLSGLNQHMGTDADFKQLFNSIGVQAVDKTDFRNPDHIKALKEAGFNPSVVDYMANKADDPEFREKLNEIGTLWPIVRGTDNSISVTSVPEFMGATGMTKSYDVEKSQEIMDLFARGYKTLEGITSEAYQADIASKKAQTSASEAQAKRYDVETEAAQFELDSLKTYFEKNPDKTYLDYQKELSLATTARAYSPSETRHTATRENAQRIAELRSKVDNGTATAEEAYELEAMLAQVGSKQIQADKYTQGLRTFLLESANVDEVAKIDYNLLPKEAKKVFDTQVEKEAERIKASDAESIQYYGNIAGAAAKINPKELDKVTGIVDASINSFLDFMGIDKPVGETINETQLATIRNIFIKLRSGSQVTTTEFERLAQEFGTNFKADATGAQKIANALESANTSMNYIKSVYPAYYAKNIRPLVEQTGQIAQDIKGKTGQTSVDKSAKPSATPKSIIDRLNKDGADMANGAVFKHQSGMSFIKTDKGWTLQ